MCCAGTATGKKHTVDATASKSADEQRTLRRLHRQPMIYRKYVATGQFQIYGHETSIRRRDLQSDKNVPSCAKKTSAK
jgi:hypothetical protein